MQRTIPQINTLYVSSPYGFDRLMTKKFPNYKYRQSGILLDSGTREVTRYAKDYTIQGVAFTLLVIAMNRKDELIEKALDKFAKSIEKDNRLKSIVANPSLNPVSLGATI